MTPSTLQQLADLLNKSGLECVVGPVSASVIFPTVIISRQFESPICAAISPTGTDVENAAGLMVVTEWLEKLGWDSEDRTAYIDEPDWDYVRKFQQSGDVGGYEPKYGYGPTRTAALVSAAIEVLS